MNKFILLPLVLVCFLFLYSCTNTPKGEQQTILTGTIKVLVDESLAPIMHEQLEVFQHSYPNSNIELVIKPENQVVNDLINDSAAVAVLTRLLNDDELKFFEVRGFKPRVSQFANDAVALITAAGGDSTFTVNEIVDILRGQGSQSLVFDNANSGTVRYLKEIAGVDTLPSTGMYALQTNADVIAYVHDHPGTIGVLGVNWLFKPDSASARYMRGVRTLKIKGAPGNPGDDEFYLPSQSNMAERIYPLIRPVYFINAEPRYGLGMGFSAFVSGDRGQRIILKSGLMPDSLPPREIFIRKK